MRVPVLLATLALAACASPNPADFRWIPVAATAQPTLMFGMPDSDQASVRLQCDQAGTRIAVMVPGLPRGATAEAGTFPTRLRLFLGSRELDLSATGTPLEQGGSLVEAPLPDPARFFSDLATQGRLVAVTFAGRTKAPAPAPDVVEGFRVRCPAA